MNIQPRYVNQFYFAIVLVGGAVGAVIGAIIESLTESVIAFYVLGFFIGLLPGLFALAKAKSVHWARENHILQPFLQSLTTEDAQTVVAACSKRVHQDTTTRLITVLLSVMAIAALFGVSIYLYAAFQRPAYTERQFASKFPSDYAHVPQDTFNAKVVDFVLNNFSYVELFFATILILAAFFSLQICAMQRESRRLTAVCPDVMKELGLLNASDHAHNVT